MEILKLHFFDDTTPSFSDFLLEEEEKVKFIKNGFYHITIVTNTNNIYVYGRNTDGQLGLVEDISCKEFVKINFNVGNIKFLECGYLYTIIVNDLNEIYFAGTLNNLNSKKFIKLEHNFHINCKSLICGGNHLFILTNNNFIYGFGNNLSGQLGLGEHIKNCDKFTKINSLKVKDIKCGHNHSVLLDFNGSIYTTGYNASGALGLGHHGADNCVFEFTRVQLPFTVTKIFANTENTFILSNNNELYGTGINVTGQLGLGDSTVRNIFTKIKLENCNNNIEMFKSCNSARYIHCNNNIYCSGKVKKVFTKLLIRGLRNKFVNILPLLIEEFIVISDYKINEEVDEINELGLQLLSKLRKNQLTDIDFICYSSNLTKRKRDAFEDGL